MSTDPGNEAGEQVTREVYCEDAFDWLKRHDELTGASVVTSLPDVSGLDGMSLGDYREWLTRTCSLVLERTPPEGVCIFYQTDIKRDGTWIDKGYYCQKAAEHVACSLLWHKIVCRAPAGTVAFGRPGYAHLLCFSRSIRDEIAQSWTDVLPTTGEMLWSQATGVAACELACKYVLARTETRTVVDPFCGVGTVLAVANRMGLSAVGVERSPRRAQKARQLRI